MATGAPTSTSYCSSRALGYPAPRLRWTVVLRCQRGSWCQAARPNKCGFHNWATGPMVEGCCAQPRPRALASTASKGCRRP
eukprot:8280652-Pyramimonas_sp.AAC.1